MELVFMNLHFPDAGRSVQLWHGRETMWVHGNSLQAMVDGLRLRNETIYILEDDLKMFTGPQRFTLFILNAILMTVAVVGNICVFFVSVQRKNRCLYKCCLLSLAVADFIMGAFTGMAHLSTLSRPMLSWKLGSVMCSVVPFIQIMALLVNSVTLTCIAVDRYQTIVHALRIKWDPSPFICYAIIGGIWMVSAAIAYPMYAAYTCIDIIAVKLDPEDPSIGVGEQLVHRCMTFDKAENTYYFAALLICIFLPLLVTFMWLYVNIATLIWIRRKPPSRHDTPEQSNATSDTNTDPVWSTSAKKYKRAHISTMSNSTLPPTPCYPNRAQSMEKKLRTFKVILMLMIIFFVCRLPVWIFMVVQMALVLNKPYHWFIAYILNAISLLNSALNPFLYTFLNDTIRCGDRVVQFCAGGLLCWKKAAPPVESGGPCKEKRVTNGKVTRRPSHERAELIQ